MKLALYHPWIYLHGGIERSLLELLKRSRHDWRIYTGYYDSEHTFPELKDYDIRTLVPLSVDRGMATVMQVAWKIYNQRIPLDDRDALVVWCDGMGDMAAFRNAQRPVFNICSTPLRAAFDPVYARQAMSERPLAARIPFLLFQQAFKIVDRFAWRKYDGVIATSEEVKSRIVSGGLYPDGPRMRLHHPGIDCEAMSGAVSHEPLLLAPGRIMWTKNLELAIEAFVQSKLSAPWELVIAGYVDNKSQPYLQRLKNLAGNGSRVRFVSCPSDQALESLYRRASAVLFPPLNEDWGIVPLEAMAWGKPVIANRSGGPAESVKDGETGWLLPPQVQAWADALTRLEGLGEQLPQMARVCRAHVEKFDWQHFASGIDDAFEEWASMDRTQGAVN